MNVKVCYGCPLRHVGDGFTPRTRKTRCAILQAKLDGVKGLGLLSIDFKCPTKEALFVPGQQVTFLGRGEDCDDYGSDYLEEFTGWVMGWRGSKVRIVSMETNKPICKILPRRLTLTGKDTRRVCIHCGMPEGVKVSIKMPSDTEAHAWICREDYSGDFDWDSDEKITKTTVLPCEYEEDAARREESKNAE